MILFTIKTVKENFSISFKFFEHQLSVDSQICWGIHRSISNLAILIGHRQADNGKPKHFGQKGVAQISPSAKHFHAGADDATWGDAFYRKLKTWKRLFNELLWHLYGASVVLLRLYRTVLFHDTQLESRTHGLNWLVNWISKSEPQGHFAY